MRRFCALAFMLALLVPPPAAAQTPLPSVAILQNSVSANGNGEIMPVLGFQVVTVQITNPSGAPTFTVNFEGAVNEQGATATPSTFSSVECTSVTTSATLSTNAVAPGQWRCTVTGLTHFRARLSGYSGTGTVRVIGSSLSGSLSLATGSGGGSQFNQGDVASDTAKGNFVLCRRADTAAVASGVANGDYAGCLVDASGQIWVSVGNGSAVATNARTQASGTASVALVESFTKKFNGTSYEDERLCTSSVAISQTASTKLVSGVSGKKVYICDLIVVAGAAEIVNLVSGTGSACATSPTVVIGSTTAANGLSFAANGGVALQNLGGRLRTTVNTDDLCLTQSGSNRVAGVLTYIVE